jgi:hypothetical protein
MVLSRVSVSAVDRPARVLTHAMHSGRLVVSAAMIAVFCGTVSLLGASPIPVTVPSHFTSGANHNASRIILTFKARVAQGRIEEENQCNKYTPKASPRVNPIAL